MFIFGKNNNHLIKNNHKKTFSLPQKIKIFQKQIINCVCGYDFMIFLTKKDQRTYCYYQSAIHSIDISNNNNSYKKIIDVATDDGLIIFITETGQLYAVDFDGQKLINGQLKPKKVNLNLSFHNSQPKQIKGVFMSNGQIFLKLQNNLIAYLKRNHWIQTKTFTDPVLINQSKNNNIIHIDCNNDKLNLFLTNDGVIYYSQKSTPLNLQKIQLKQTISKIGVNINQVYAINVDGEILRIKNIEQKNQIKTQKVSKMMIRFIDLKVSDENFYVITENQQVWVWGMNANGQLGLSDYEPRNNLYPMITLQKYYIKNIYIGQGYTCCEIIENRIKQSNSISHRSNWLSSVDQRSVPQYQSQNPKQIQNHINFLSSSIDRDDDKMEYDNENESKQSGLDVEGGRIEQKGNIIVNINKKSVTGKGKGKEKEKGKAELVNKSKASQKNQSIINNESGGKLCQEDNTYSSCKRSTCGCGYNKTLSVSKGKLNINKTHNRSVSKSKSVKKPQVSINKVQKDRSSMKIVKNDKMDKLSAHKYITPNKIQQSIQQPQTSLIKKKSQKPKIQLIYETHRLQIQKYQDRILQLQRQLRVTNDQKNDLFELLKQKNIIIDDITSKLILLEDAIQQNQKTLSARDNQAQDFYLKQKQYQLHITNLQHQIEKMIEILNKHEDKNQQQNRSTTIYMKQMERIKIEIKDKIEGEKQYYRERIRSIERKFDQEKNLYQIQIRNLQEELQRYKHKQVQLFQKLTSRNDLIYPQNSSNLESPSFQTVDIKTSLRNRIFEEPSHRQQQQSKLSSFNDNSYFSYPPEGDPNIYEEEKYVLKEKNRYQQLENYSKPVMTVCVPNQKSNNNDYDNDDMNVNDENRVDAILHKIQTNKSFISKSAHKLVHLLEKDSL